MLSSQPPTQDTCMTFIAVGRVHTSAKARESPHAILETNQPTNKQMDTVKTRIS